MSNSNNGRATSVGPPSSPDLSGQVTIQVRVPYKVVGLVVGPKGATIKRIQQQSQTYIVTPSRDREPVFEITGSEENVSRAKEEIQSYIALRTGLSNNNPDDILSYLNQESQADDSMNDIDRYLRQLANIGKIRNNMDNNQRYMENSNQNRFNYPTAEQTGDYPLSVQMNRAQNGNQAESFNFREPAKWSTNSQALDEGPDSFSMTYYNNMNNNILDEAIHQNRLNRESGRFGSGEIRYSDGYFKETTNNGSFSSSDYTPLLEKLMLAESQLAGGNQHGGGLLHKQFSSDELGSNGSDGVPYEFSPYQRISSGIPHLNLCSRNRSSGSSLSDSPSISPTDVHKPFTYQRSCILCHQEEVVAALVPCGHNSFCMSCANSILKKEDGEERRCPLCRQVACQAIRIYA